MIRWLRRKLRSWLLDPEPPPSTIEVRIDGRIVRAPVAGAVGTGLSVQCGRGVRIVSEAQAVDRREFWRAWRHYQTSEITWEDGSRFDPEA